MNNKQEKSKLHVVFTGIIWGLLGITAAAVVVHFLWNMAISDLFEAAKMSFKNAVGLVLLATMTVWIFSRGFAEGHVRFSRHNAKNE